MLIADRHYLFLGVASHGLFISPTTLYFRLNGHGTTHTRLRLKVISMMII